MTYLPRSSWFLALALVAMGCASRGGNNFLYSSDGGDDGGDGGDAGLGLGVAFINGVVNGKPFEDAKDTYFGLSVLNDTQAVAVVDLSEQAGGCERAGEAVGGDWRYLRLTIVRNDADKLVVGEYPVQDTEATDRPDMYATAIVSQQVLGGAPVTTEASMENSTVMLSMVNDAHIVGSFAITMKENNGTISGSFNTERYCSTLEFK